jgi:hypothetical protein
VPQDGTQPEEVSVKTLRRITTCLVVGLFSSTAYAGSQFGDWEAGVTDDRTMFYAFTLNDSGDVFGEWCSPSTGNCTWLVGMKTGCESDSSYPVLANADSGAAALSIRCAGKIVDTQLSRYQFESFKDIETLLKNAHKIGFAIPMQSDRFQVVRFSLNGCHSATAAMESAVAKAAKASNSGRVKDTRDTEL